MLLPLRSSRYQWGVKATRAKDKATETERAAPGTRRGDRSRVSRALAFTRSLPLDRRRRLAGDVVDDAVDPGDLVDDAVGDAAEELVGERAPVGGHEVVGVDGAESDDALVGAVVP